ncbi:hypothetical protein [Chryseobacterium sp.]|uniref:hypothetical protein n=1 Tax=Chryseobacterium sp. TaxID=1871047 RepID=UPI002FC9719E
MKKKSIIGFTLVLLLFFSCSKEDCVTCIAESKSGKIIETRLACDKDSEYLRGFINGFKERHREGTNDSTKVYCAYSE